MSYDRTSAPADLERLETFVNSARRLFGEEHLAEPRGAARWLREHGFADRRLRLDDESLRDLVRFREALRDHLGGSAPAATATLNEHAARTLTGPRWTEAGTVEVAPRVPDAADAGTGNDGAGAAGAGTDGVDGLIGRLLTVAFAASTAGTLTRLKPCQADDCRWMYFDRSPAGNGVWCSMDTCGARHKMRVYRSRRGGRRSTDE